jgi:hypothetical protein
VICYIEVPFKAGLTVYIDYCSLNLIESAFSIQDSITSIFVGKSSRKVQTIFFIKTTILIELKLYIIFINSYVHTYLLILMSTLIY